MKCANLLHADTWKLNVVIFTKARQRCGTNACDFTINCCGSWWQHVHSPSRVSYHMLRYRFTFTQFIISCDYAITYLLLITFWRQILTHCGNQWSYKVLLGYWSIVIKNSTSPKEDGLLITQNKTSQPSVCWCTLTLKSRYGSISVTISVKKNLGGANNKNNLAAVKKAETLPSQNS